MKHMLLAALALFAVSASAQSTLNGPDAPTVEAQSQGQSIELELVNPPTSNNFQENYAEVDPTVTTGDGTFRFQGYKVYQVVDATVTATELVNLNRARLLHQSDVADTVSSMSNFSYEPVTGLCLGHQVVDGANLGTETTITFDTDLFANAPLEDSKEYCIMAVAYAHNGYYGHPNCPQGAPYLQGKQSPSGSIQATCITHNATTSIAPMVKLNEMQLQPNPASDNVQISVSALQAGSLLEVYDLTGKVVVQSPAAASTSLDISAWHSGLYFVKLTQPNGNATTQKLVVN